MADRDGHDGPRRGRGSLVERAAEKLGGSSAPGIDPASEAHVEPIEPGPPPPPATTAAPAAETVSAPDTAALPRPPSPPPALDVEPKVSSSGTAQAAVAAAPPPEPKPTPPQPDLQPPRSTPAARRSTTARPETARSKSRFVELDFGLLKRNGILVPDARRTRTIEEFRIIKRSVLQSVAKRQRDGVPNANLIMVTSTRPAEGKTFTSINLAMSLAFEKDRTVLLVDADLSRPSIPKELGITASRGLLDVLENPTIELSDVMLRTSVESLSLLPAGGPHRLSTEFLASERMKRVMSEIARRYRDRIVIIDSPPVLSTSEPSALALHVGHILFVVQAEKTAKSAISQALELIDRGPTISMVLNRAHREFGAAQFGSYYRDYHGGY